MIRASGVHVLLVVHDPSLAASLEELLLSCGWNAGRVGGSVEDALDTRADVGRHALIIQSEDVAGLCRAIRADPRGESAYVLAIYPEAEAATPRLLVDAGADDLIAAPISLTELSARLALAESRLVRNQPTDAAIPLGLNEIGRQFHVQQAILEGLFEAAPEGVVVVDTAGRIVRVNSEFSRMFGYPPEEAEGQPLNDLIVPIERRDEGLELDTEVSNGDRVLVETVRRHKDGTLIHVSVLATDIELDGPVGAFGIYRDITEKKRQEEALRESEERYRALFDQSPVGVFLCGSDLRITHCNTSLTRIVGTSFDQLIGAHLVSLRDRRLIPGLRAALGGEPASYEGPYRSRTGEPYHVSIRYAPLRDAHGHVVGGMGVMENITDRVRAEMHLRAQAAEMERVNAAVRERTLEVEAAMQSRSRLYTAMNHELRTPISAIMLYQELLLAGSLGPLEEEQLRALRHSHTAASHLLELVRDILDLSKIEAGKVSVQPVEFSLAKLLEELRATADPLAERYGSTLQLRVDDGVGTVITDPQRVRQILLNFVSNAAKYGKQNPIEIRSRRTEGDEVVIEVVDQGIGIDAADLGQIFEDFVQLGDGRDEGTGLGLAICRRLADLLGARLEVESQLEKGSVFRLILPGDGVASAEAAPAIAENDDEGVDQQW